MMATMTKLPSDSFWPSGGLDTDVPSSSIISPLALPRGAVAGYFDQIRVNPASQSALHNGIGGQATYSPLSPGVRAPVAQHQSFLSPHLSSHDSYSNGQYRSSSLPPNTQEPRYSRHEAAVSGSINAAVNVPTSPALLSPGQPRSIPGDGYGTTTQAQMIRRLIQQNGRIREAWEAERKYMEANRERAEEVYKEERAFMEEERAEWDAEKEILLQEIQRLHQQLMSLGVASPPRDGFPTSTGLRGGGGWEASPESMKSSQSSQDNTHDRLAIRSCDLPTGSPGPAITHHSSLSQIQTQLPQQGLGIKTAPKPLEPLPERVSIGPNIPSSGLSPAASEPDTNPVPIVDVQEIHPELEGIPIKATTLQKSTFTDTPSHDGSKDCSRSPSPLNASGDSKAPRASKEHTMQVLAAHESARLIMHAGHTPSHSLSLMTTVASSGAATTTSSSGESTPTIQQGDGPVAHSDIEHTAESSDLMSEGQSEQLYETTEDRPLKFPLMVRNMPAHDEIFFRKLSDKLEEVSKHREASLPAVLKDVGQLEGASETSSEAQQDAASEASGASTEKDQSSPKSGDEELEIPLKIKKSSNFGAPFGVFR
ncbi:hypothetical protein QBC42DRAFT_63173 [Cladorrhinum samala]|uniref:Uncharacterized protein n=1 Tax=Cladorrhinum samala TaxID=585594 RepID=A0AAV9I0N3_9PEZI|nr:hypothetical protein QBC42DRAFT_63173 [Cladorrhinum samala]